MCRYKRSPSAQMGSCSRRVALMARYDYGGYRIVPWFALRGNTAAVTALAFSADGQLLAAGFGSDVDSSKGKDGGAYIWSIQDGALLQTLSVHGVPTTSLAFHPQGHLLASGSREARVRLWWVADGQPAAILPFGSRAADYPYPLRLAFSADGTLLTAAGVDDTVRQWWISEERLVHEQQSYAREEQREDAFVKSLALSPDGRFVATGAASAPPWGYLWWQTDGAAVQVLGRRSPLWGWPGGPLNSLAFSPNGRRIAGGPGRSDISEGPILFPTRRWAIRVWQVADGTEQTQLRGHRGAVHGLTWSPDGALLASGSDDGTVRLWAVK